MVYNISMEKIKVTICTGTACFVMGASELMLLEEKLPPELKDKVEITGSVCMGSCKGGEQRPPFVQIDNEVISNANVPEVIDKLIAIAEKRFA